MRNALRLLVLSLFSAALVAPAAALANDGPPTGSGGTATASFEVVGVDAQTRVAKVVLECVGNEYNGRGVAVKVGDGVEMSAFTVGAHLTGTLNKRTDPPTVVAIQDSTCGDAQPKPPADDCPDVAARNDDDGGQAGDCPKADDPPADECPGTEPGDRRAAHNCPGDGKGDRQSGDKPREPKFRPSFLNRVWRFEGSA